MIYKGIKSKGDVGYVEFSLRDGFLSWPCQENNEQLWQSGQPSLHKEVIRYHWLGNHWLNNHCWVMLGLVVEKIHTTTNACSTKKIEDGSILKITRIPSSYKQINLLLILRNFKGTSLFGWSKKFPRFIRKWLQWMICFCFFFVS